MSECQSCLLNANVDALPPYERAYLTEDWRLAHASSTLPGYMVLSPLRHVVALDELRPGELAVLGPLLAATTAALRAVVRCSKTYVMLFAEKEGWGHAHFHIVPRMPDFDEHQIGPETLEFVNRPESEWVTTEERARLAAEIGPLVNQAFRQIHSAMTLRMIAPRKPRTAPRR